MLWYKAWLETWSRFLISLAGIVALCAFTVYHLDVWAGALFLHGVKVEQRVPLPGTYYDGVLHSGQGTLARVWIVAATLLMMGGLLREKSVGASSFTLALPVGRRRLMSVRICVGLIEVMALAIVPWGAMCIIAAIAGTPHLMAQAGFYIVLLAGGGLIFFSLALLISSLVEGEYTAPLVSYGLAIGLAVAFNDTLRAYSPWRFLTGEEYFDRHTSLLTGPIPWMHLAVTVLIAAILMAAAVRVIEKREFRVGGAVANTKAAYPSGTI
jgi:ABC-type transport system involved in multi-copper enzyme maturation permease subunit